MTISNDLFDAEVYFMNLIIILTVKRESGRIGASHLRLTNKCELDYRLKR